MNALWRPVMATWGAGLAAFIVMAAQGPVMFLWTQETICGAIRPVQLCRIGIIASVTSITLLLLQHLGSAGMSSSKARSAATICAVVGVIVTAVPGMAFLSLLWVLGLWDSQASGLSIIRSIITLMVTGAAFLPLVPLLAPLLVRLRAQSTPGATETPARRSRLGWMTHAFVPVAMLVVSIVAQATIPVRCGS